ncbi:hypothetical protein BST39_03935 [Mycobacterium paraseoulense]|uniref:Uncharacterized protein n=1 Tax=Mycobacterium paraseoulense TaxID=590652 RepID=A0A1X0IFR1_9MYCO|nr:hypothetical protein BST39_03935 [Mycobacterium paraseoulense]
MTGEKPSACAPADRYWACAAAVGPRSNRSSGAQIVCTSWATMSCGIPPIEVQRNSVSHRRRYEFDGLRRAGVRRNEEPQLRCPDRYRPTVVEPATCTAV